MLRASHERRFESLASEDMPETNIVNVDERRWCSYVLLEKVMGLRRQVFAAESTFGDICGMNVGYSSELPDSKFSVSQPSWPSDCAHNCINQQVNTFSLGVCSCIIIMMHDNISMKAPKLHSEILCFYSPSLIDGLFQWEPRNYDQDSMQQ